MTPEMQPDAPDSEAHRDNLATQLNNMHHFETHHQADQAHICMQRGGECSVRIETKGTADEQRIVERAAERAFSHLDNLFDNRFAEVFKGLRIEIGDDLTSSGGEAFAADNRIVFDRQKMLMSLADAEAMLPAVLDKGDWTSVMSSEEATRPGSCLEYNIIHEVGHILDGRAGGDNPYHRVSALESPTKYGRQADQFSTDKDHEAFAEGFTYLAYGKPVSETMNRAISNAISRHTAQA